MNEVARWLEHLGLGRYAEAFADNDITFEVMPALSEEDLKELGLSLGHRRILQNAIAALARDIPKNGGPGQTDAASASPGGAERRQLTVMFCDLVGSTELSQRLDPEELGAITRAFQDACARAIQEFDGFVARYTGDGLLAYFGYPQAREDAAERAIRAGLGVVAAMEELNRAVAPQPGGRLAVRVGIASGPVVVGDLVGEGAARENTVVGETPNLAARLQSAAPPDGVYVASSTKQLAGEMFDYDDAGQRALKGMADPVHVWCVTGEAVVESRFDAMRAAKLTPLVGRDQELALLLDRWQQALEGDGQVVLLCGEPGIGKSRVTQALRTGIPSAESTLLHYQCSQYHTSSALYPVVKQIQRSTNIDRDEHPVGKLDKLESLLGGAIEDVASRAPLFASLLSIPAGDRYAPVGLAPEQHKQKTLEALSALVAGYCARSPVLMIFEDVHWADPTSLEFLGAVIEEARSNRILVLVTHRPEFDPPWGGHTHITALTLNRFSRKRAATLIDEVAAGKELPAEVRDEIIGKTDGIPLFIEELTKMVLESGLVEDRDGVYQLTGPLQGLAIPSTLQDSLMARLDRLGEVRETAQIAAVIGREFTYRLLARVSGLGQPELDARLARLTDAALVFARGAPPDARYEFKHAMVQEAAYESLLKSKRKKLHARVAKALQDEAASAEPELIAHHLQQAGRHEPAAAYWQQAGQRALERSANDEAVVHLRAALDMLSRLARSDAVALRELEARLALGPALMSIKGYAAPEIEPVYARARELGGRVGQPAQLFAATWGLWLCYQQGGRLSAARELSDDLLALAARQDDRALMLQARHAAWATCHRLGELAACRRHAEEGIRLYDVRRHGGHAYRYGGHDPGVCAEIHSGMALWCLGYPDQALERAHAGVVLGEQLSHPFSHVDGLFGAARVHLLRGEFESARMRAEEMIAMSTQHGFSLSKAWGEIMRGSALGAEDGAGEYIEVIRRGLDTIRETGAKAHVPYMTSFLIDAYRRAGRVAEGLKAAADALETIRTTGERNWEAEIRRLKGVLLGIGPATDSAEGEASMRSALEIARAQGAKSLELRAAVSLGRLKHSQGKPAEALALVRPLHEWFKEGLDTADLKQAKALLDRVA